MYEIHANSILGIKYPLGISLPSHTARSLGMGNASSGEKNKYTSILGNPANLGYIRSSVFTSLVAFNGIQIRDTRSSTEHFGWLPTQFSVTVPAGEKGSLGFSFQRTHEMTTKWRNASAYVSDFTSIDSISSGISQNGGKKTLSAGYGHSFKRYSVGLSYKRIILAKDSSHIKTAYTRPFDTKHGTVKKTVSDSTGIEGSFNGIDIGAMAEFAPIRVGASVRYFLDADIMRRHTLYKSDDTLLYRATRTQLSLPPQLRTGISYEFPPHFSAAADMELTAWNRAHTAKLLPNATREYALSVHCGAEYIPAPQLLTPKYWQTMQYRAGFSLSQLPRKTHIRQQVSVGLGLPLKSFGILDLAIVAGRRQSDEFKTAERFASLVIGLSGSQQWSSSSGE